MSITAPASITTEEFKSHMEAIKAHYLAPSTSVTYPLPIKFLAFDDSDGSSDLQDAINQIQAQLTSQIQTQQQNATNSAQQLQSSQSTNSFVQQMKQQEEQADNAATTEINNGYNQLISVGTKHPSLQGKILNNTQMITAFITNLFQSVCSFLSNLVNTVKQIIGQVVTDVENFFSTTASSIESFFSSL